MPVEIMLDFFCDGNGVNQGFFEFFNTTEPWRTTDNMFL